MTLGHPKISIELMLLILAVIVSGILGWTHSNDLINKEANKKEKIIGGNSIRIEQNRLDILKLETKLSSIDLTLAQLVQTNRDALKESRHNSRDRWTAEMMMEHDNHWLKILQELHPELKHDDVPNIRDIQSQLGYALESNE